MKFLTRSPAHDVATIFTRARRPCSGTRSVTLMRSLLVRATRLDPRYARMPVAPLAAKRMVTRRPLCLRDSRTIRGFVTDEPFVALGMAADTAGPRLPAVSIAATAYVCWPLGGV